MAVDPELQVVLDLVNAAGPVDPAELGAEGMRASMEAMAALFGAPREDVVVDELELAGRAGPIAARRYVPAAGASGAALVWFHGGGWVIGSLATHDVLCRELAAATDATVVAVDYRLAPEHRFPAAVDDAIDAAVAVATGAAGPGVDPARVALGGDSAGGHLATVVARRLRDLGGPLPAAQVLVYPVTDLLGDAQRYPSRAENATGYLLTTETMDFFVDSFVSDPTDRAVADASPIRSDDLSGLAPALVLTAEYDPLRDEGEAYADALVAAGVDVVAERHDGAIHMFVQLSTTRAAQRAVEQIASFVRARC
jgi:acetyl esterase